MLLMHSASTHNASSIFVALCKIKKRKLKERCKELISKKVEFDYQQEGIRSKVLFQDVCRPGSLGICGFYRNIPRTTWIFHKNWLNMGI